MELQTTQLLDLSHTLAGEYVSRFPYPWEALAGIQELILELGPTLPASEYDRPAPDVWVHRSAIVAPTAYLGSPCIIGRRRRSAMGPLSGAPPWWAAAAWWETPWS